MKGELRLSERTPHGGVAGIFSEPFCPCCARARARGPERPMLSHGARGRVRNRTRSLRRSRHVTAELTVQFGSCPQLSIRTRRSPAACAHLFARGRVSWPRAHSPLCRAERMRAPRPPPWLYSARCEKLNRAAQRSHHISHHFTSPGCREHRVCSHGFIRMFAPDTGGGAACANAEPDRERQRGSSAPRLRARQRRYAYGYRE